MICAFFESNRMKVAPHHYLLAYTSPFSIVLGAVTAVILMIRSLHNEGILQADVQLWVWICILAIPAGLVGAIAGVFVIWGVLSHIVAMIQGWPFQVGEEIIILTGKRKNTVAKVYEVWHERGQIQVDYGEKLKKSSDDVFCAVEVCRYRKRTQNIRMQSTPLSRRL
jgi:hypothetical protein